MFNADMDRVVRLTQHDILNKMQQLKDAHPANDMFVQGQVQGLQWALSVLEENASLVIPVKRS